MSDLNFKLSLVALCPSEGTDCQSQIDRVIEIAGILTQNVICKRRLLLLVFGWNEVSGLPEGDPRCCDVCKVHRHQAAHDMLWLCPKIREVLTKFEHHKVKINFSITQLYNYFDGNSLKGSSSSVSAGTSVSQVLLPTVTLQHHANTTASLPPSSERYIG